MGIMSAIYFFVAGAVAIFGIATFYHACKWAVKDIEGNFQNVISMIMLGTSMFILATAMLAHGQIAKLDDRVDNQDTILRVVCERMFAAENETDDCHKILNGESILEDTEEKS